MSSGVFDVIVTAYWPYVVTDGCWKLARSMIACCICTTATSFTVTPLHCARAHTFSVESVDATGSVSAPADVDATTLGC